MNGGGGFFREGGLNICKAGGGVLLSEMIDNSGSNDRTLKKAWCGFKQRGLFTFGTDVRPG